MASGGKGRQRQRGSIDALPSGALRVRVYAGRDPITKRRLDLTELVPAGPSAAKEAERVRTRLLNEVDERRNPRTRATVGQLIDRWFAVLKVEPTTRRGYEGKIRKHIRPLLGELPLTRLDVEALDSFYAELRRCGEHCDGRPYIAHRTPHPHRCDEHKGAPCMPADPSGCHACRRVCRPHVCRGLSDSTVRQVHWIVSGALDRAVVWKWISVNPAHHADKPALPHPEPEPPSAEQAAHLIERAWASEPDWGAFVWTKMTTGARRGEMCGLRWRHLELASVLMVIKRTVYVDDSGQLHEKDTKTHQQRRVVLDPETVEVLREHRHRAEQRAKSLGVKLRDDMYVFPGRPDGRQPMKPDTATQRYKRMAERLGIETTLKNLRHYSATELIHAGVDVRTVAGRLGHGGGGATTLRVYTAWSVEADQRAAATVSGRMPVRPGTVGGLAGPVTDAAIEETAMGGDQPYGRIAADLRGAIACGALPPGQVLPSEKELAARYGVAPSTAHRAVAVLVAEGLVRATRGHRATVVGPSSDDLEPVGVVGEVVPLRGTSQ
jgi:integrase